MANAEITGNKPKSRRRKAIERTFEATAIVLAAGSAIAMMACANYIGKRIGESNAPFRAIEVSIEHGLCNRGAYIGQEVHYKKISQFDMFADGFVGNVISQLPKGSGNEKIVDIQVGTTFENGVKIIFEDNETKALHSLTPQRWPTLDCLNALKNG